MLGISQKQVEALSAARRDAFVGEMAAHCAGFSPRLAAVLGPERMRAVVEDGLSRAEALGFSRRGPCRLILELQFLFGAGFADDPQHPWAAAVLDDPEPMFEMRRAEALHARALACVEQSGGPGAAHDRAALNGLRDLVRTRRAALAADPAGALAALHPARLAFSGQGAIDALVAAGAARAQAHGLTDPVARALLIALMFAFGHRCDADPRYPWIAKTLALTPADPAARALMLERKAMAWLDAVLADGPAPSEETERP